MGGPKSPHKDPAKVKRAEKASMRVQVGAPQRKGARRRKNARTIRREALERIREDAGPLSSEEIRALFGRDFEKPGKSGRPSRRPDFLEAVRRVWWDDHLFEWVQYVHRLCSRWARYKVEDSLAEFVRTQYEEDKGGSIPRPPAEPEARLVAAEWIEEQVPGGPQIRRLKRADEDAWKSYLDRARAASRLDPWADIRALLGPPPPLPRVRLFTLEQLVAWYEEGRGVLKGNEKRPAEAIAHWILKTKLISPKFRKPDTIPSASDLRRAEPRKK